jgi:catechol 2,3-dioxygenase-like lactoylglutathione lyase family enzyme
MINSLSHITLIVRDVEKMANFLRKIFDTEEVYSSARKNFSISYEKFFIVGNIWIAVMEGISISERSYNHIAFKVSDSEFDEYVSRIKQPGLEVKPGRERVDGEFRSIYFYDYDNHLFELHTGTLQDRLLRYSETSCTGRSEK